LQENTVIHFADYGGPYGGNFIASLGSLNQLLQSAGWRQVLVFTDIAKNRAWVASLASLGIPLYFVSKKSRLKLTHAVHAMVKRENAQILHTHFSTFDVPAWMVKIVRRLDKQFCEVIWHIHSPSPRRDRVANRLKDAIRFSLGRSVYKIVVSEGGRQNLLDRGLTRHKTLVVPNGIDLQRARQTTRTREAIRRQFALDSGGPVLLQLGWDPIGKGVDFSLQAVENLVSSGVEVRLLLVGAELLQRYIRDRYGSAPPAWLKLLPFTEHIADYFQVADIFVSASRAEGFPYSVGEAMAYGLPVIASDIRGLEWAHASPGVVFFPNEDVSGLANAVTKISNWSDNKKQKAISANRAHIEHNYSLDNWGRKMLDLYERITA
jgi:glycosyltransferase involved in cell wall biosynthesis